MEFARNLHVSLLYNNMGEYIKGCHLSEGVVAVEKNNA